MLDAGANISDNDDKKKKIDEFAILIRIVKHERIMFLKEIHHKQLFIIS